jgi:hypothetical protein
VEDALDEETRIDVEVDDDDAPDEFWLFPIPKLLLLLLPVG